MSSGFYEKNLNILSLRFPALAEKIKLLDISRIAVADSADGGICYAALNECNEWIAVSDCNTPIKKAQTAIDKMQHRLNGGLNPAVIVGLNPGYILESVFKHCQRGLKYNAPFRRIYVVIDSIHCLAGWLKVSDKTEILKQPEISFHCHENVHEILNLCKKDIQRSHLFIPLSSLPESKLNEIIAPLADFYLCRQKEEALWLKDNDKYYNSITDEKLAEIISGKASRKPRLLMPAHISSSVVQYSARDTCKAFEDAGWETMLLKIERAFFPWLMIKCIHDFKPDIIIFINHLRNEDGDEDIYPKNLMFVTWIQDFVPLINSKEMAKKWNAAASEKIPETGKTRRRDILIGYIDGLETIGYLNDRLVYSNMIVNPELFYLKNITEEHKLRYACDVCFASNRSETTEEVVETQLYPFLKTFHISKESVYAIHDLLWKIYREEKTITSYTQLGNILSSDVPGFHEVIRNLKDDVKSNLIQNIFWSLNDLIYRHVVLEWCNELGVKLNLYGKGWKTHPHFQKYAKGTIEHGEELATAYRSAKYCLHLNAAEGLHQRLFEIVMSGGTYIKRNSAKRSVYDKYLQAALIKFLKNNFCAGNNEVFSRQEEKSILKKFFEIVDASPNKASVSLEKFPDFDRLLTKSFCKNISWLVDDSDKLTFKDKKTLDLCLKQNNELGAKARKRLSLLLHVFVANINGALQEFLCGKRDPIFKFTEKQMLTMQATLSLKKGGTLPEETLKKSDQLSPFLKIKIIEKLFDKPDYSATQQLFHSIKYANLSLDEKRHYIEWAFVLNITNVKVLKNLEDQIYSMYKKNQEFKDIFTSAAWKAFGKLKKYKEIINYSSKDYKLGKISDEGKKKLAVAFAGNGNFNKAKALVNEILKNKDESNIKKDCYSKIAWRYFYPKRNYRKIADYCQKDIGNGLISEEGQSIYIFALTALGKADEAMALKTPNLNPVSLKNKIINLAREARRDKLLEISFSLFRGIDDLPTTHKEEYCSLMFERGDYDLALQYMDDNQIEFSKVAIKITNLHSNSKLYIHLLEKKYAADFSSFNTSRAMILCYGFAGDFAESEQWLLGACEFLSPSDVNKLIFNMMTVCFITCDCRPSQLTYACRIDIESLSSCPDFLLAALVFAISGNFDSSKHCIGKLYMLNPYFFAQISYHDAQLIFFMGIISELYGNTTLAEKCLNYSEEYVPIYKRDALKWMSAPTEHSIETPGFVFPWHDLSGT